MNSSAVKGIEASSSDIVVEMKKELDKKKQTKKKKQIKSLENFDACWQLGRVKVSFLGQKRR